MVYKKNKGLFGHGNLNNNKYYRFFVMWKPLNILFFECLELLHQLVSLFCYIFKKQVAKNTIIIIDGAAWFVLALFGTQGTNCFFDK